MIPVWLKIVCPVRQWNFLASETDIPPSAQVSMRDGVYHHDSRSNASSSASSAATWTPKKVKSLQNCVTMLVLIL